MVTILFGYLAVCVYFLLLSLGPLITVIILLQFCISSQITKVLSTDADSDFCKVRSSFDKKEAELNRIS